MALFSRDVGIGIGVVLLALISLFVIEPMGIVSPGFVDIPTTAPNFWPRLILFALIACGVFVIVQAVLQSMKQTEVTYSEPSLPKIIAFAKFIGAFIGLLLYYWAVHWMGMWLASTVALCTLMMLGGELRWKILLSVSTLIPMVLYFFFTRVANIPLPLGLFES